MERICKQKENGNYRQSRYLSVNLAYDIFVLDCCQNCPKPVASFSSSPPASENVTSMFIKGLLICCYFDAYCETCIRLKISKHED
eukprot:bmy_14740T0